jgi:hypothetical protein
MDQNEGQEILNQIQYKTGHTLDQIAKTIGYSRPYLNKIKLKGGGEKIIGILREKYGKYLDVKGNPVDKMKGDIKAQGALLSVLTGELASLRSSMTGENETVIRQRLEKAAEDVLKLQKDH